MSDCPKTPRFGQSYRPDRNLANSVICSLSREQVFGQRAPASADGSVLNPVPTNAFTRKRAKEAHLSEGA